MSDANDLRNELWNSETLQMPETITAANSKEPSVATTLRREYRDLVMAEATTATKFDDLSLQHTDIQQDINSLQLQLQAKQAILGKILEDADSAKTALEAATVSVKLKLPQTTQAEIAELRSSIILESHRTKGKAFKDANKSWFEYENWVHPNCKDNRRVGPQTEAILYVFYDLPCFFSKTELELFLGVISPNHNVTGALLKMVSARMLIMTPNNNGTDQYYLANFPLNVLDRRTMPDINNRPNEFTNSIKLRKDNGEKLISSRRTKATEAATKKQAIAQATKKRESPAKKSAKVTPTTKKQKRSELSSQENPFSTPSDSEESSAKRYKSSTDSSSSEDSKESDEESDEGDNTNTKDKEQDYDDKHSQQQESKKAGSQEETVEV